MIEFIELLSDTLQIKLIRSERLKLLKKLKESLDQISTKEVKQAKELITKSIKEFHENVDVKS